MYVRYQLNMNLYCSSFAGWLRLRRLHVRGKRTKGSKQTKSSSATQPCCQKLPQLLLLLLLCCTSDTNGHPDDTWTPGAESEPMRDSAVTSIPHFADWFKTLLLTEAACPASLRG